MLLRGDVADGGTFLVRPLCFFQCQLCEVVVCIYYLAKLTLEKAQRANKKGAPVRNIAPEEHSFSAVAQLTEFLHGYRPCPKGGGNKGSDSHFDNICITQ